MRRLWGDAKMLNELAGVLLVAVLAAAAFLPLWLVFQAIIEKGSNDGQQISSADAAGSCIADPDE